MSKREIRAKRLVAAVLLAISVQMWSAPPLWAAEASVQTETSAAGEAKETKETKNAKATDSETGGEADADEGENVVVPVIGYSTRSAAGSDYGVMPLADAADPNPNFGGELAWYTDDDGKTQWKTNGKGELTGVTSINGAVLQMDVNDDEFMTAIGVKSYANSYGSAFGWYARAEGQYSVAVGYAAETDGTGVALGYDAKAKADGGTSLGMAAEVGEEHTNSVAIGSYSVTNAANQVSFGHKTGDNDVESGGTYKTDLFRSLTNISDIDMHGNISLGGEWKENTTSGLYESNGKGELTGVTKINGAVFRIANDATVLGANADAGERGVAFGSAAKTVGEYGVAIGAYSNSSKSFGVALGYVATINASGGTALGADALVAHENSVALGSHSVTNAANQVSFGHKTGDNDVDSGDVYETDLFRSLTNISDIEMHGALTGVTTVNGATITGTGFNGVTLSADGKVNGAVITSNSFNGVTLEKGADSHYKVGGVDVTKMQTDVAGKADAATVTALDTRVGKSETDIGTLKTTVGDSSKGLVKDTADLKAAVGDGTTGLAAVNTKVGALEGKTANIGYAEATGTTVDGVTMKAGNIGLGGEWSWNETSKVYESNGKGRLTGLTSINDMNVFFGSDGDGTSIVMGTTLGYNAISVVGLGYGGTIDGEAAVYVGSNASALGNSSVAIGAGASARESLSTALGGDTEAAGENSTAVGNGGRAKAENSVTLGYSAKVGEGHTNSVAVGANSATTAADQVAFGTGEVKTVDGAEVVTWTNRRSLAGISDIDMAGNISLGGEWKENTTSGLYESNGKGELNGVNSINGVIFAKDSMNNKEGLLIGTLAPDTYYSGSWSVMIGTNIDNQAIDAVGIGNDIKLTGDGSVAIGNSAEALSGGGGYPTAIGFSARAIGDDVVAIGASSYAEHEYSVALGDESSTSAENQVSFGHKAGDKYGDGGKDTYGDDLFRRLVNVADIEMHGALTGVTGIDGVTVSGTDASTGLTVGGNAVIGKTDTPFSSTGFAVAKDGAVTAKTVNGAAITSNSFNGVTLEKGADSHYKVGGVDVTKMQTDVAGKADAATVTALDTRVGKSETDIGTLKTTVGDSSKGLVKDTADLKAAVGDSSKGLVKQVSDVDTAYKAADTVLQGRAKTLEDKTAGISRSGSTTTLETNTSVSSSGITTNKATVSGATATTLENGKLTVGAATVQNTGFAVGSSSLNNGSLTIDGNNKLTTAGLTASKVTVGAVIVSGGKVSGLTDAALSAVSTEAVTGKQLNATNTTVSALDTAYKAADTQIRTDFAAADTTLQNNIDAKVAQTAYDTKMSALDSADTALGSRAAALETAVNDSTTGLAAVNTKVGALDTAYQAADTQIRTDFAAADTALSNRAAALETVATGMSYDAGKNTTTFTGGVTATVLTAGEFKVGATGFGFGSDGALTAKTFNGIEIQKDESKVMVGGIDLTALSNGDVVTDNTKGIVWNQDTATTTIETNTAISSSGINTNAVTASGTVKASEFVEGDKKLSDKYAAKTALADYTTTTDMNTKFADYATTTAVDTKLADYAKSDSVYSKAAADTAFAKAGDVDALKTTLGDSSKGLVKQVSELDTAIGTKVNADATGLSAENQGKWKTALGVDTLADTVTGNTTAIGTLATAVNDSTTGLAAVNTKVGALDTAYKAADTQIRTDFAAADTALSDRAVALETAATGMSYDAGKNTTTFTGGVTATVLTAGELKVGATGFGFGSDGALTAKTVNGIEIKKDGAAVKVGGIDLTALSKGDVVTDNTKGIDRNQDTATTTIETNTKISSSGITTNAVTASGTVKAGEFVEGSQKLSDKYAAIGEAYTAEKAALKADKSDVDTLKTTIGDSTTGLAAVNTKVGALDTAYQAADTQIRTDFAAADNALKTELNTAIDEKAKKATDLAGYGITDAYTKNDADAKITAATADMATKTQLTADIGTAKTALENAYKAADTQIRTDFAAADTALSDRAAALETAATGMSYDAGKNTTTFTGGMTATVLTAGELKVGATGFGFGSDGALTAKTVNGIEIKKDGAAVKVGGIDLTALSKGDVVTDNTKGIDRNQDTATTTIETNTKISSSGITTNAVTASGTVKASEFVEGDKKLSDKYAAKTALDDYTTTTDMNTKLADYATTTAVDTKLADYAKSDSVYSKAAADTAFAKADASNLPSDVSGWQSKLGISDISSKLAGFSYDNTSGTTTIGGVKLKGGTLADVKSLNGKAVGADSKGITIDGIGLKDLSERVTAIENNGGGTGGGSTADTEGIKRTDVADGSGKTTVEGATSFTKDGLKTANLEATTAALGGVNFAAGAVTGVSSINGISFADGKLGGVSLSGGKVNGADITSTSFNGVDVKALKNKVDNLTPGSGGGTGGGDNTGGISKPDGDTTNIEGSTSITTDGVETNKVTATDSITVADATNNKTTISDKGIVVAEGKKNQVTISEDGIHVGKNSSVVNDTDGFITDKGLYIGVSSSSDTSTAKFSVAPNGNLSSKAGDYGFSNTSADGAKFTHSGDTAYGTGSQLDTTIQGNKVTTGRIDTDELYVDGNKVTVAGGTIGQTDAVDNHLSGTDADGNTVTNDFKTSAVNGTTQAAEKTSADGKESTKTVNNTSAGGTSVTTSRTTTDSKDNVTVKESSFGTNEKGMTLSTSNKVTDKDGKVTKDTSGTTTMTGDSISVSKTTTTTEKDADGNEKEVTKTSGTTIGSGEVTLKREDGSTIEVGSAIEGMQSDMRELDGRVSRMGVEIKEVGALSAALAGLHPQPENANSRADFAMAMGSYEGKQALAVGGFYRPDKRTMLSIGASTTSSKHMMNMGISIALDRLPEAERRAEESKTDLAGRMKVLEADYESRLEKLEAAYEARLERLEARYARLQEAAEDKKETAAEQPQAEKPAESEVKGDEADRAVS